MIFFLCWIGLFFKKMKKNMIVKLKKKKLKKKVIKLILFDSFCVCVKMRNIFFFFVKNIDKFLNIVFYMYFDSIFYYFYIMIMFL